MKWQIKSAQNNLSDLSEMGNSFYVLNDIVAFDFIPENKPLEYFLNGIKVIKFLSFIEALSNKTEFYSPPGSLRFYKDLDWEDLEGLEKIGSVGTNDIVVYHEFVGDTILSRDIVYDIVIALSKQIYNCLKINDSIFKDIDINEFLIEIQSFEKSVEN